MDVWTFDTTGQLVQVDSTSKYDAFSVVGNNGKLMSSSHYSYGTINQLKDKKKGQYYYTVSGSSNGQELFEFIASNTNVEWGQIKTLTAEMQTDFLLSSVNNKNVVISSVFILNHCKGVVTDINHSHPDGNETPTGLMEGVTGDVQSAISISKTLGYCPRFAIFSPISGNYIPFGPHTVPSDFAGSEEGEFSMSMRPVTSTATARPRKKETLLEHLNLPYLP
jgi:hypothetical protein